jgi:dienelactone hydrolase
MRLFEKLIFVFMFPATLWLFHPHRPGWMELFVVVSAILVLVHAWREGMHWQMVPAYIAVGVLLLWECSDLSDNAAAPYCAIGVCLLLAASLAFSWALPMFELPKPTGKYPVGTRLLHLVDSSRAEMHAVAWPGNREVVVQLWYPAATDKWRKGKYRRRKETSLLSSYQAVLATHALQDSPLASGRFPVIIHNPAWHGFRNRGTFMTQELASHGFVVAAISHPYNSSMVELSNGSVATPDYGLDMGYSRDHYIPLDKRFALADEELAVQTEDCRFVLDQLERFDRTTGHPLEARLQMDRVGGYGYSFGGAVCAELAREDERVCSALELDGVLHGSAAVHGLRKPLMLIDSPWMVAPSEETGDEDIGKAETKRLWKTIADTKAHVLIRTGGFRVIIEGISHPDFSDQIFMSPWRRLSHAGLVPPKRVALILNAYIVAFFRQTLCNVEERILVQGAQSFPEARLIAWKRSEIEEDVS